VESLFILTEEPIAAITINTANAATLVHEFFEFIRHIALKRPSTNIY